MSGIPAGTLRSPEVRELGPADMQTVALVPWRGKDVAPYLRHRVYQLLAEQGRMRFCSVSIRTNKAAIRFKEKLGVRMMARGWVIELFGPWRLGSRAPTHC